MFDFSFFIFFSNFNSWFSVSKDRGCCCCSRVEEHVYEVALLHTVFMSILDHWFPLSRFHLICVWGGLGGWCRSGMTLPYHVVRIEFDALDGLKILLNMLRHMATLGTDMPTASKQVTCQACHALRNYLRAHFVVHFEMLMKMLQAPRSSTNSSTTTHLRTLGSSISSAKVSFQLHLRSHHQCSSMQRHVLFLYRVHQYIPKIASEIK